VPSGRASARTSVLVLIGYVAIAYGYFGAPLGRHPGRDLIGSGRDLQIFVWDLAWWPHASLTWQNPFVSHAIYAPSGINLAWVTSVPGIALAFAPVTLLFGPDVAFNVAEIAMPALSAFTAYLLCRHLTRSLWPALVGGYLYGFSSYELGQELGHLNFTAVFLLPLIALAVVRYLEGDLGGRGVAWRLGVLYGLQFWISTEVFASASIMLAVALVAGYVVAPRARPRLRALLGPVAGAVGVAAVVAGPMLAYALIDFQSASIFVRPALADGDLVNVLLPTRLLAVGRLFKGTSEGFFSDLPDQGLSLGLPTLVIIVWFAFGVHRSASRRFLALSLVLGIVLTLGTSLYVRGDKVVTLPWAYAAKLPVLDNLLPTRFAAYVALAGAVIVALWAADHRGWLGWILPALAAASLVPALWNVPYRFHPERWRFFTRAEYKCLPRGESIAVFPFGVYGSSTLWQAETGFWFRMPGGYLGLKPPPASLADPTIKYISDTGNDPTVAQIIELVKREHVDRVVSIAIYAHPDGTQMHRFGVLSNYEGVYLAPTCGYPSLRHGIHPTSPHPAH
jgi:hypothetical protein